MRRAGFGRRFCIDRARCIVRVRVDSMDALEKARRAREIAAKLAELRDVAAEGDMPYLEYLLRTAEVEAVSICDETPKLRVIDGGREDA